MTFTSSGGCDGKSQQITPFSTRDLPKRKNSPESRGAARAALEALSRLKDAQRHAQLLGGEAVVDALAPLTGFYAAYFPWVEGIRSLDLDDTEAVKGQYDDWVTEMPRLSQEIGQVFDSAYSKAIAAIRSELGID